MGKSLPGRRIEDRALEPTTTGHPRFGREDEVEAIRKGEKRASMWGRDVQFWFGFASDRRDDIDGASEFLKGLTAARDDEGDDSVVANNHIEEFTI